MPHTRTLFLFAGGLLVAALSAAGPLSQPTKPIEVQSVVIQPLELADVPARETGVLASVSVREGEVVSPGDLLARIDDAQAQLVQQKAQIELAVAHQTAENDVKIRFAEKAHELAQAELRRARESVERYPKSISQSDLEKLQLDVDRTALEIEQAEREAQLERLKVRLQENALLAANQLLQRHQVQSPIRGMVVEVKRRPGEWVQPGETVVRVIRLDRLRADGFVKVQAISGDLNGAPVTLSVDLPGGRRAAFQGTVVFVSPEIDPVNGQVRIWAEIDNPQLLLKPGLRGRMVIGDTANQ